MAKKITQYPASGGNPDVGSLIDISELISGVYTSKKLTIQQLLDYLTANLNVGSTQSFYNNTGSTILAGTPVEFDNVTSNTPNIRRLSSSSSDGLSKIYVAQNDILNTQAGNFIENGIVEMNTSAYSVGTKLYWNISTSALTTSTLNEDQLFVGIVLTQNVSGKIFVSPTRSPQLMRGATNQIPLFTGPRKLTGSTHFTFVDNAGTEVGFTFDDGANNITKVGVTYINVESEGIASNSVLRLANWADNTNKGIASFRKSRGSKAVPTKVLINDVLGTAIFAGQTDKIVDGVSTYPSGMTTGEIIVRALNNFVKNYDSYADETISNGLTQFEIWLQGSGAYSNGDFTPLNTNVFSVDGDGKVRLKNGKLVFQYDSLQNVNLFIGDINDNLIFDENTAQLTLSSKTKNTELNSQTGTTGFYPKFQLVKGETGGNFPYNNNILGSIATNGVDFIKLIAREDHTLSDRGTDIVFYALLTGGGSYQQEALRLSALDGKVIISGAYKLPLTDGANGTSLITDGAGNVAWGTPSASASTSMQTIGRNSTGSTLYKGTVVYISGSTGNRPNFIKARADIEATSAGTFGVVVSDIANNSDGYVCTIGTISGLDTRSIATNPFTTDTLVDGDAIYLSPTTAGYITNVKPSAPNHLVYIGKVVQTSPTNGTIVYRIQNGYELEELHNVAISGLANNDVLQYESATQLWKNKPLSTASEDLWKISGAETFRGVSFNNNSTSLVLSGGIVNSTSASTQAKNVSGSSFINKVIGLGFNASVVSTGRYTGIRGSALLFFLGGGFRFTCSFNISDTAFNTGCRQFYGLGAVTTDLTYTDTVLVGSLLNLIGVGSDSADANLQIFHNDGAGSCTKIDLGGNFPANRTAGTALTSIYEVQLLNLPNSPSVYYRVYNKENGSIATGLLTTDLPLMTQGLNFFASRVMGSPITGSGQFILTGNFGVYSLN